MADAAAVNCGGAGVRWRLRLLQQPKRVKEGAGFAVYLSEIHRSLWGHRVGTTGGPVCSGMQCQGKHVPLFRAVPLFIDDGILPLSSSPAIAAKLPAIEPMTIANIISRALYVRVVCCAPHAVYRCVS